MRWRPGAAAAAGAVGAAWHGGGPGRRWSCVPGPLRGADGAGGAAGVARGEGAQERGRCVGARGGSEGWERGVGARGGSRRGAPWAGGGFVVLPLALAHGLNRGEGPGAAAVREVGGLYGCATAVALLWCKRGSHEAQSPAAAVLPTMRPAVL